MVFVLAKVEGPSSNAMIASRDCYKDMNLFMHCHNLGCIIPLEVLENIF
jgi:hypothetical protein